MTIRTTDLRLIAADGEPLSATLFVPNSTEELDLVVIINAGAGISASYYGRFAEALSERGVVTITYDYRGIGKSRPVKLRGYKATIRDWAERDVPTPLLWARANYPERCRAVLGHSIGGFLAGFVPDPKLIDALVLVGAHTGYWRDYARWSQPFMWAMWHAAMPVITRTLGYFPGRPFGLPQDLPAGVAYDWAARTRPGLERNFRLGDGSINHAELAVIRSRFAALRANILAITFSDDPFSTPRGTKRLRDLMSGCEFDERRIDARGLAIGKIGHFGFFRSVHRKKLWPLVIDWLVATELRHGRSRPKEDTIFGWTNSGAGAAELDMPL